jgi:hypothetical protein
VTEARLDAVVDGDTGREAELDVTGAGLAGTVVVCGVGVATRGSARPLPDTVAEQPAASSAATTAVHPKRMLRS